MLLLSAPACSQGEFESDPDCFGGQCDEYGNEPVCGEPLIAHTIEEEHYVLVDFPGFEELVYFYVPEIRTNWRYEVEPFDLWIVEGRWGQPLAYNSRPLSEETFHEWRQTLDNWRTTAIPIDPTRAQEARAMEFRVWDAEEWRFRREPFVVETGPIHVPWQGADSIDVTLCRP
jgi:hypothetical protein